MVIEACAAAAVTGQAEVDRCELADPQAAKVVLDALAQLVRIVEREDGTAVVSADRDLADDRQPVGVGVDRLADQIVDDTRAVVLGRIDVIDSGGDRGPEHADRRWPVRWLPEGEGAGELHRTVPRPPDPHAAKCEG
jgi:hypothetical protein